MKLVQHLLLAGLLVTALSSLVLAMRAAQTTHTPVPVDVSIAAPPATVAMDGSAWLVFELHVANRSAGAVTLTEVEVTDGNGTSLAAFASDRLTRRLDRPADGAASPHEIRGGGTRVVYLELAMDGPMPATIRHRVSTASGAGVGDVISGPVSVPAGSPVALGPPLAGGPWAAVHHPDWERGHRRIFYTVDGRTRLPGRFAIDFVKLDDRGHTARGDGDLVAGVLGYGAEVLATADATVAAIRDEVPEVERVSARRKHAQDDAAGNFVSLDLGGGRFAVYEHLKPGSVRVTPGQRVRRGEILAQLGFTGDSTGPHLHLHVGDAAAPLGAEGLPFVFDRFEVLGRYPDVAAMSTTR